jgi:predicted nucleic acid-binding protein
MNRRSAVLDASFWINACQVGLVRFLPDYFCLFVCSAVETEILHPLVTKGLPVPAAVQFRTWREDGKITLQDPARPVDWLHIGENAAIALALEQGYVLLVDDQHAYHRARAHEVVAINSADFGVMLYAADRLDYAQAKSILSSLEVGKHLYRTAMAALGILARQRGERP